MGDPRLSQVSQFLSVSTPFFYVSAFVLLGPLSSHLVSSGLLQPRASLHGSRPSVSWSFLASSGGRPKKGKTTSRKSFSVTPVAGNYYYYYYYYDYDY